MPVRIRAANETDIPSLYHFICSLEETSFDYDTFEAICRQNINTASCIYLVATTATATLTGFLSVHTQYLLHHCGKVAEIQELFVEEKYRKLGIGRDLVNTAEKILFERNCLLIEVTAQTKRPDTHRFYESMGFINSHKKFTKDLL
jgi:PhnO protein